MKIQWSRFLGVLFLGLAVWLALFTPARAATGTYVMLLALHEDFFWNYDFLNNQNTNHDNVDWTINMVFYQNADIAKVKAIYWDATIFGNEMWENVSDYGSWPPPTWLSDKGTKDWGWVPCSTNPAYHMRVYGPMYNISWGYYVLGSTHMDFNECLKPYDFYGFSESAEGVFAQIAEGKGYWVERNLHNLYNPESVPEGNHYWQSDGKATAIRVP